MTEQFLDRPDVSDAHELGSEGVTEHVRVDRKTEDAHRGLVDDVLHLAGSDGLVIVVAGKNVNVLGTSEKIRTVVKEIVN